MCLHPGISIIHASGPRPTTYITICSKIRITVYSNITVFSTKVTVGSKNFFVKAYSIRGMVDDQYRGLLTEREREILRGDADVSDNYRYRVVSRIRTKIENVDEDVEVLAENREDLLEELREVVCED